ncbi:MAG: alpha/beta fold hydrolase [Elusimicrobia bacterium]|nr:alpha/beta fold hydrolase [Elusimicrobiota bacterium]
MSGWGGLELRTADLRGLRTAWLDNGKRDRPVALFLHGYLDTPRAWSEQVAAFCGGYQVLLPFGRGVGESQPPRDTRRYGAYSTLLDHLEILRLNDPDGSRPVHVVGHDVGGVHAWMLAAHPNPRVKTVTILNSAHPKQYLRRMLWPRQLLKSWYVGAFQVPYVCEALLWIFHDELMRALSSEGWRPPADEPRIKDFQEAAVNAMNQYRQFVRDIPHFLRENAGPTATPVLAISSEDDRYLVPPSTLEFADIASRVTVRVIKGKHWIHREQPERINRLIADFWSQP